MARRASRATGSAVPTDAGFRPSRRRAASKALLRRRRDPARAPPPEWDETSNSSFLTETAVHRPFFPLESHAKSKITPPASSAFGTLKLKIGVDPESQAVIALVAESPV